MSIKPITGLIEELYQPGSQKGKSATRFMLKLLFDFRGVVQGQGITRGNVQESTTRIHCEPIACKLDNCHFCFGVGRRDIDDKPLNLAIDNRLHGAGYQTVMPANYERLALSQCKKELSVCQVVGLQAVF